MIAGACPMVKRNNSDPNQLTINFEVNESNSKGKNATQAPASRFRNVVSFTDARTLELRREAVDRVIRSGIFKVSNRERN